MRAERHAISSTLPPRRPLSRSRSSSSTPRSPGAMPTTALCVGMVVYLSGGGSGAGCSLPKFGGLVLGCVGTDPCSSMFIFQYASDQHFRDLQSPLSGVKEVRALANSTGRSRFWQKLSHFHGFQTSQNFWNLDEVTLGFQYCGKHWQWHYFNICSSMCAEARTSNGKALCLEQVSCCCYSYHCFSYQCS